MSGLKKNSGMNDIPRILSERSTVLDNVLKAHEAYWVMVENENFQQIGDMLLNISYSLEKINSCDTQLEQALRHSNHDEPASVRGEIDRQAKILKKISRQEKMIFEDLKQHQARLSGLLRGNRAEGAVTKAYSQNIPRKDFRKFMKNM